MEESPKRVLDKRRCRVGESSSHPLLLRRAWREILKHFLYALIQVFDVLVGVVGKRVARGASPDQLLSLGIEEIDDHGADLIRFGGGGSLTKASCSKSPPTPASTKSVVERIQR